MALLAYVLLVSLWLFGITVASPVRPHHGHDSSSSNGIWQDLPSLPQPRQEHSVAALNDRIYITGGILSNVSYSPSDPPIDPTTLFSTIAATSTTQYFDIRSSQWHNVAALPVSINHGNIATIGGKIYMLGGLSGANPVSWDALSDTFVYDPILDKWDPLARMPVGTARGACAVGVYGDEIYLAGGMTQLQLSENGIQASVSAVTSYNTRTNNWTTTYPPLPGARDHVAGAIIGHTFYVAGGRDHSQFNWKNDTWALDLTNIAAGWIEKAPMLTARGGLASAAIGDKLYTFGGEGNPDDPANMVFDNVEAYDTRTDVWRELTKMGLPRHGIGAATVDGKVYIPGGGVRISAAPTDHFDVFEVCEWD